jgi:hypothetical protein
MITRETVYKAFYDSLVALKGTAGIVLVNRRLFHWSDVPATQQPALFVVQGAEQAVQKKGFPTKWLLNPKIWVYVNTNDDPNIGIQSILNSDVTPATLLNPILDLIESTFPWMEDTSGMTALGGLASHCWISGTIETFEGLLGPQEVAIVPVEILTA